MDRSKIEKHLQEARRQVAQCADGIERQQEILALAEAGQSPIDIATARQLLVILGKAKTLHVADEHWLEKKLVASQAHDAR